jgi:hypothetical protein
MARLYIRFGAGRRAPMLVLADEDGPACPLPAAGELVGQLPAESTRLGDHSPGRPTAHLPCQQPNRELRLEA